jgi:hypothetical protein
MTSRTRHIAVIAVILLFVIPDATRREQSWAIAWQAAIGGMFLGVYAVGLLQDERQRRQRSADAPTTQRTPPEWTMRLSPRTVLTLSSVAFAVLWTAGMLFVWNEIMWWPGKSDVMGVVVSVIWVIAGGFCGLGWHRGYGEWFRQHYGLDREYHRMPNS